MRNGAFATGIINITGYIFLDKWFGVMGAVVTKILSSMIYFMMMNFYYKETKKALRKVELQNKCVSSSCSLNPSDS